MRYARKRVRNGFLTFVNRKIRSLHPENLRRIGRIGRSWRGEQRQLDPLSLPCSTLRPLLPRPTVPPVQLDFACALRVPQSLSFGLCIFVSNGFPLSRIQDRCSIDFVN